MNHHFRSFSESTTTINNTNGGRMGGFQQQQLATMATIADIPDGSSNGVIRIHSDSQQSLDRLFNPLASEVTNVVPLRQRNLPSSFFSPRGSQQTINETANEDQSQLVQQRQQPVSGNLHSRSTSFDYWPKQQRQATNNTQSQLHQPQNHTYQPPAATDNAAYLQRRQPAQQQSGHHYCNFSTPAFMTNQVTHSQPPNQSQLSTQQPQQDQVNKEGIEYATQPAGDQQYNNYQHYQPALSNQAVTATTTPETTVQQQQYNSQSSSNANQQPRSPNYHQQYNQHANYHQLTYTQPQTQQSSQPQPQQSVQQQNLQPQYDNYCHPQLVTQVSDW